MRAAPTVPGFGPGDSVANSRPDKVARIKLVREGLRKSIYSEKISSIAREAVWTTLQLAVVYGIALAVGGMGSKDGKRGRSRIHTRSLRALLKAAGPLCAGATGIGP